MRDALNKTKSKNNARIRKELREDLITEQREVIMDFIWSYFEDDVKKAFDNNVSYVHNIYMNAESGLLEEELPKIKLMLWIEYVDCVLRGSDEGFNEWYVNYC